MIQRRLDLRVINGKPELTVSFLAACDSRYEIPDPFWGGSCEHPGAIPQRQLWHSDEEGCEWVLGSFMPDQDSFLATFESHGFRALSTSQHEPNPPPLMRQVFDTTCAHWNTIEVLFCNDHKSGPSLKDSLQNAYPCSAARPATSWPR